MRILFIAQRVPFPPDRGDKITTYNEIKYLSRNHEVEVLCLADGRKDLENVEGLKKIASKVYAEVLHPIPAKIRSLISLILPIPFSILYFHNRTLHKIAIKRHETNPFDAVIVYSSSVAQYAEKLTNTCRVMQFADLDSLKWKQYADKNRFFFKWLFAREAKLLLGYERKIAHTFNHSLVCTPLEKNDFIRLIPGATVHCVANGVDFDYFKPLPDTEKIPCSLVFTGVMDYFPNVEGVLWFVKDIFPLIQKELPGVTFTICGSKPSPEISSLASKGIEVTGRVPDTRPYLDRAQVAVLPLRIARGIQNKLLEAMSMGLPCIATTSASGGLIEQCKNDIVIEDTPDAFAEKTIALLLNKYMRDTLGQKARSAVENYYGWETQTKKLEAIACGNFKAN